MLKAKIRFLQELPQQWVREWFLVAIVVQIGGGGRVSIFHSNSNSNSNSNSPSNSKEQAKKEQSVSFWKEFQTPDGIKYYHNSMTGATTWDKPDELKTPEEMDKKGDWAWIPDYDLGFIPARKIQTFNDGRVQLETEDGKVRNGNMFD